MSSDKNPECNEAALQRQFERDLPELRTTIGDANRDGNLSASELEAEIKNNPQGPLANLLRIQVMPALRNMQIEKGALKQIAEEHVPATLPAAAVEAFVARSEQNITARTRRAVENELATPLAHVTASNLCSLANEVNQQAEQTLKDVFSASPKGKDAVSSDLNRGVLMIKGLKSVEIGSVQVLYDHLATDDDKSMVKSGIDQRVKQATSLQQAPVKPATTRC